MAGCPLMACWVRVDILVIDDFLIRPLNSGQAVDLLDVIEDRAQLHSTIVTSQLRSLTGTRPAGLCIEYWNSNALRPYSRWSHCR
jgi:hypothetical protein